MSYHYRIYGLHLETNREIGLLPAQPADQPDLLVNWSSDESEGPHEPRNWEQVLSAELRKRQGITLWRATTADGVSTKLRFRTAQGSVDFLLDSCRRKLWITHSKEDAEADLHSYFVGPALGCVLRLRGTLCLHASVVKIDNYAVAIVGKKKAGKSTSAAGLAHLGAAILSDDMAVLSEQPDHFEVQPGYPQIRLWPRSIEAIYQASAHLPKVYSHRDKRYLPLGVEGETGGNFWPWPLPLAAIYCLEEVQADHAEPHIEAVAPQDRIMTLVKNTFGSYVVTDAHRRLEFELLARLSKVIPIRRLVFTHNLTNLRLQSEAILKDVRSLIVSRAAATQTCTQQH